MILKYNLNISDKTINNNLKRLTNQIYKLLPQREEQINWRLPLDTIILELIGMNNLFGNYQEELFFSLLCKLQGLTILTNEEDFHMFRRSIFECLSLIGKLRKIICQD